MLSFFKKGEFVMFKETVNKYCEAMNYHGMELTDEDHMQLSWYMGNSRITPEARGEDLINKFHFEIQRSLARRYSFELLLRGDEPAYQEFVQSQKKDVILPLAIFKKLSEESISLDENAKAAIRISCFLSISDKAKELLKENGYTLSNDSEDFLSQLAVILQENNALFPITKSLTTYQVELLQKVFWPNMHLRHMMYTEGGINMTKSFYEGLIKRQFKEQDFMVWKWRWLTNLFGFQSGPGAKYFDADAYQLSNVVISELEKKLISHEYPYLDNYLLNRVELAGLNSEQFNLSANEQLLLGHLAAYFHQINILMPELGKALYSGYIDFKYELNDAGLLAESYEKYRKNIEIITPTYVPAVINNAYLIFKNKFSMATFEAIKNAAQFMCQFLKELYSLPYNNKQISCMNLAKEPNLQYVLEQWHINHNCIQFELNENFEMIAENLLYYNIALIPKNFSNIFIDISEEFKNESNYTLGNHSYPHITLVQFKVSKDFNIDELWKMVQIVQEKLSITELNINLNETKSKLEDKFAWIQLQIKPHPDCYKLHQELVYLLNNQNIPCLNAPLEKYDPHLTLVHTTDLSSIEKLKAKQIDINDEFYLALGESDRNWQFVEILKTSHTEECRMKVY